MQKEAEKKPKYKSLRTEIQRMWNLKCTIIPVITGATGMVTKDLRNNLEAITVKHSADSLHNSYTRNITHNTESTAVWNWKSERWGSPLVQEKYREKRNVTRDNTIQGRIKLFGALSSVNISAPYFKQCFFQGGGAVLPPQTESNTTPPSPKTEITNILFYILNFASIIFQM